MNISPFPHVCLYLPPFWQAAQPLLERGQNMNYSFAHICLFPGYIIY
jgi:hypothetical protein